MIGIVFGPADVARGAKMRWRALEAARTAMFSQTMVVPLFHAVRHLDPGGRRQRQRHQAAAAADRRRSGDRLLRRRTRRALDRRRRERVAGLRDFGDLDGEGHLQAHRGATECERALDVSDNSHAGDRVVVTGAAGFIGSAVTRALLAREVLASWRSLSPGLSSRQSRRARGRTRERRRH